MNNKITKIALVMGVAMTTLMSCDKSDKKETQPATAAPKEITKVAGIAKIEPENGLLNIYANADGKIETMPHHENDVVGKGALLISLDRKSEMAQVALERSKISAHQSAVVYAEENLKTVGADLQKAQKDVALNEKLYAAKAITGQALDDSRAKVTKLQTEYNRQLADIKQVKNKRSEIDANVHYRDVLASDKAIAAPANGKILQWDVHSGDYITAGQKLGQFAPEGALIAVTEVDELYADKVQLGMKADILSQLDGQKIAEGEVVFMADFLKKKSLFSDENTVEDRRVRTVKVRLNPASKAIINARVDCVIKLK